MHRAAYLSEMIRLLLGGTGEGKVTLKKRVTELIDLGDAGIGMQFTDGTSETAYALIGCDGVKSRIRQVLLEGHRDVELRLTGKYAYRGLIPMKETEKAIDEMAQNSHMMCS